MKIKALIISFFIMLVPILSIPFKVAAHQSGCHRWHSCPSDSGSYTCGDTGHSNYCSGSTYVAPTPTYYEQGQTNGKAHAEKDRLTITSSSKTNAYSIGYDDGKLGRSKSSYLPIPASICTKSFTFDAGSNTTYTTSYESSYKSSCETIANTVYKISYSDGYTAGMEAKPKQSAVLSASTTNQTGDTNSNTSNGSWTGWIIGGIVLGLYAIGASWETIKEWLNS